METNLPRYSTEELALRNGQDMPEIWVGYKGKVYDVTSSELFKGGYHYFHATGIDLTKDMPDAPHLEDVMNDFEVVGILMN
jgi:predicted heme/steroid binding protein